MHRFTQWLAAGALLLGATTGFAAAPTAAHASCGKAATLKADDCCTKYLCQKYYNGCWHTVYVCYDYNQAMAWYDAQGSGARVVASK